MSVLKSINLVLRASRLPILNKYVKHLEVFRGLYSASSLGLDGFIEQQHRVRNQLASIQNKFRTKMKECAEEGSKNIVFTEDLKNMVHIADADDIDVIIKMMKKFNQQNKELRFGNFIFGPVVMRMFYILNKPNEALECFKSPELQGFFDQLITYQLLLDLLYENQRYDDMLECATILRDRQVEGTKYPRNIVVLTLAACYKLNTPKSLEYAMDLWADLAKVGHFPARRATTFFASFLLNQNKPEVSLEVLSSIRNQTYTTIRNLKVLTLLKLNRLDDVMPVLKSILHDDQTVQTFNKDVLAAVKEKLESENNAELLTEFNHVVKIFKEQNQISEQTLDGQLTSEITTTPRKFRDYQGQREFQGEREYEGRQQPRRFFNSSRQPYQRRSDRASLRELE